MEIETHPSPGSGPRVALDENILRCGACCSDAIDGGLVGTQDERVVYVVILVVGVEDDLAVGGKQLGCGCPPGLETVDIGNNLVVIPALTVDNIKLLSTRTKVVGVKHRVGTLAGDVSDNLQCDKLPSSAMTKFYLTTYICQPLSIGSVDATSSIPYPSNPMAR